jgi:shikimate dehydrogenase
MTTFGLIGKSLKHSFSKDFFTQKFADENIDAQYLNYELDNIADIRSLVSCDITLAGFNVTIPYKQSVLQFLDEIDPIAHEIGAVNTIAIRVSENRVTLKGYNTDWIGFDQSVSAAWWSKISNAVVLGAGGASLAVMHALKMRGCKVVQVSRNPNELQCSYQALTLQMIAHADLIVNCTPLGMYPDVLACPPIPYDAVSPTALVYDLVYNPEVTLFLQKAGASGATVMNGKSMLILQALASFEIWTQNQSV